MWQKLKGAAPYIVFLAVIVIYHSFIKIKFGDEITYFGAVLDKEGNKMDLIWDFTVMRYYSWSSRNIIELFLVLLSHYSPVIWKIADMGILMLLAVSCVKITEAKDNIILKWIVIFMILLYPFIEMSTAGWIATSTNYLWPASLGLFALSEIKDIAGGRIKIWKYILTFPALIYAVNSEQMAGICVIILGFAIIMSFKEKKKWVALIPHLIIAVMGIIHVVTCPGNAKRSSIEVIERMREFDDYGIVRKAVSGYGNMVNHFLFERNATFLLFFLTLTILLFIKYKTKKHGWIIWVPFIVYLIIQIPVNSLILGRVYTIAHIDSEYFMGKVSTFLIIASLLVLVLLVLEMYYLIDDKKFLITLYMIMMSGAAASMVLGFSPTIYVSGNRIFIYQYLCIYITTALMLHRYHTELAENVKITKTGPAKLLDPEYISLALTFILAVKSIISTMDYIKAWQ